MASSLDDVRLLLIEFPLPPGIGISIVLFQ